MMNEPTNVERTLGRIEGTLAALKASLDVHTDADAANFAALTVKLEALDVAATVRRHAWKWAAAVIGAVVTITEIGRALGWLPLH